MPEGQIQSEVLRVPTGPAPWDTDASSNLASSSNFPLHHFDAEDFLFSIA